MTDAEKNLALFGVAFVATLDPTDEEIKAIAPGAKFKPRTAEVKVRQLRIAKFPDATRALDAEDEIGFTAIAIGKERQWVESLTPESYNQLAVVVQEVNESFFVSYGRLVGRREGMKAGLRLALAGNTPLPSGSRT